MPQNSVIGYDVGEDIWKEAPSLNIARNAHSSCVFNSKLFIFGGEDREGSLINTIESYEVEASEQKWNRIDLAALTPRIYSIFSPLSDSEAVIIGGDFKAVDGGWNLYADILKYSDDS